MRDLQGQASESVAAAHARIVIGWERDLGVFKEAALQRDFVHHRSLIRFFDGFYGTVHFLAVAGVLLWMYKRHPGRYRLWRNALAVMTAIGLLCFYLFPLLPPRLLPASYGFNDTLQTVGGVWDFKNGAVDSVSNQFAAMPSLHTGWALWCALAVWSCLARRRLRPVTLVYPALTVVCIVFTANHYFADAVGGAMAMAAGYGIALVIGAGAGRWRMHRAAEAALADPH